MTTPVTEPDREFSRDLTDHVLANPAPFGDLNTWLKDGPLICCWLLFLIIRMFHISNECYTVGHVDFVG